MSKSRIQFISLLSSGITAVLFIAIFAGMVFSFNEYLEVYTHPAENLCGCYNIKNDDHKTIKKLVYTDAIIEAGKNYPCKERLKESMIIDNLDSEILSWQGGDYIVDKIQCYTEEYFPTIGICTENEAPISKAGLENLKKMKRTVRSCPTLGQSAIQKKHSSPQSLEIHKTSVSGQYLKDKKLMGFIFILIIFVVISRAIQKL